MTKPTDSTLELDSIKERLAEWIDAEMRLRIARINDRWSRGETISVMPLLRLPNGEMVPTESATREQWMAAYEWLRDETLTKVTPLLDDLITVMVNLNYFETVREERRAKEESAP